VISEGDRIPDARVFLENREQVSLRDLAADGPVIYFFFLFDWSST
jgi:peroxiredoxin